MITAEIQEALQGIFPSTLTTVSKDLVPNVNYISQAHFVDETHLAISWQFFNKTIKNLEANPRFSVFVSSPTTFSMWKIDLLHKETKTEGELFNELETALEAIASMQGAQDIFKLKGIIIGEVVSIEQQFYG